MYKQLLIRFKFEKKIKRKRHLDSNMTIINIELYHLGYLIALLYFKATLI